MLYVIKLLITIYIQTLILTISATNYSGTFIFITIDSIRKNTTCQFVFYTRTFDVPHIKFVRYISKSKNSYTINGMLYILKSIQASQSSNSMNCFFKNFSYNYVKNFSISYSDFVVALEAPAENPISLHTTWASFMLQESSHTGLPRTYTLPELESVPTRHNSPTHVFSVSCNKKQIIGSLNRII